MKKKISNTQKTLAVGSIVALILLALLVFFSYIQSFDNSGMIHSFPLQVDGSPSFGSTSLTINGITFNGNEAVFNGGDNSFISTEIDLFSMSGGLFVENSRLKWDATSTFGNTVLQNDIWYNIAIVGDGVETRIYLDGDLEMTIPQNIGVGTWAMDYKTTSVSSTQWLYLDFGATVNIGVSFGSYTIRGSIKNMNFWNNALSQSDIEQAMFNSYPFTVYYDLVVDSTIGGSATGSGNYEDGEIVQITATPDSSQYFFTGWTGDYVGTTNPQNIVVDSNKNIMANFEMGETYYLLENNNCSSDFILSSQATSNHYSTLSECQDLITGDYYLFSNNECNLETIYVNDKTINHFEDLQECQDLITGDFFLYTEDNECIQETILLNNKTNYHFESLEECEALIVPDEEFSISSYKITISNEESIMSNSLSNSGNFFSRIWNNIINFFRNIFN